MKPLITKPQLKRLMTLWGQLADSIDLDKSRDGRIAWFAQQLDRPLTSCSEITSDEAKRLIDGLQAARGIPQTVKPRRQPRSRHDREKAGTEGRRDQLHDETTILAPDDEAFGLIRQQMSRLGMNEERLQAFLRSPRNPINGRQAIRTLHDANRVRWALKGMADHQAKQLANTAKQAAISHQKGVAA